MLEVGQLLGEFEIIELLGKGGMGAVYKARQTTLKRVVALKLLQPALALNEGFVTRFHNEAFAAAALNHPNLVQVYAAGQTGDLHWFAMEFVDGESLQQRLNRQGRLDPAEALAVVMHVANALDYAWRKAAMIHRDIKPDNVFLSNDGEVKLGDLGLAKSPGQDQSLTLTGSSMGTPLYISPEQAEARDHIDLRSDIYSLGATLYHLLCGTPVYTGNSPVSVMMKHVSAEIPDIRATHPLLPQKLASVVQRTLQKAPEDRYSSYPELSADLQAAYTSLFEPQPVDPAPVASPIAPSGTAAPGAPPPPRAVSPESAGTRPSSGTSLPKVAVASIAAVAFLGTGAYLWTHFSRERPADQSAGAPSPRGAQAGGKFAFQKGDVVAFVGSGLADRMHKDGWLETLLQSQLLDKEVRIRNMGFSGDCVDLAPRPRNAPGNNDILKLIQADVVFVFLGYNESHAGVEKAEDYRKKLVAYVQQLQSLCPNGKSAPRVVLFSPIAHENLRTPNLPDGVESNLRLRAYSEATQKAALETGVKYVDLFGPSLALYTSSKSPLTINGIHLNGDGNRKIAQVIVKSLLGSEGPNPAQLTKLREAVLDKSLHWHLRFRATDEDEIWGGQSGKTFGPGPSNAAVLQQELKMLDVMTANRDAVVWAAARGKNLPLSDSNVPGPLRVESSYKANPGKDAPGLYRSGEEALRTITVPNGFKAELFADEKRFPALVNPVQLQVDTKGRLWAATWGSYPKWEPGKPLNDALLILPDANLDGKADKAIEFARVHNPLGFEFWNGGVLVTEGPDLLFLKDSDGDDVADERTVVLQGLGTANTHQAANTLVMGPDGAIYWQSGALMLNSIENPWGPVFRTADPGIYRFDPRTHCVSLHVKNPANPHGISFDLWGYLYSCDAASGRTVQVRPGPNGFTTRDLLKKEVRPVTALRTVSSTHFPEDMQGDLLLANVIGFRGLKHYKLTRKPESGEVSGEPAGETLTVEEVQSDGKIVSQSSRGFLLGGDPNFRPSDMFFGEDGSLFIADWHSEIIGHIQFNARDPKRDHSHGRIYRVRAEGRPFQPRVNIAGQPVAALLDHLQHPVDGVRHRTHVELSERDPKEVGAELQKWISRFDPQKKEHAHHLVEALWVGQQHHLKNFALLNQLLQSPEPHARHAALLAQQLWFSHCDAHALSSASEPKNRSTPGSPKSGIISETREATEVRISTVPEKMMYDVPTFAVTAGKKVKLTFSNPDLMPHNLVLVKPGKAEAVGTLALELGARGFEKAFVPDSPEILAATKLVDPSKEDTIHFTCPDQPGEYPFLCTFPGHHQLMRGTMVVRP